MNQSNQLNQLIQSNNSDQASRLVLGTAQLGMNYGIANQTGKPDVGQAMEIVEKAWDYGIREYDTAQGYGESEKALGNAVRSLGLSSEVRVMTKLDPDLDHLDKTALEQAVKGSLTRLNVPILYGLMLHREEYLELWGRGLGDTLKGFITKGLTKHIGVSVYSPDKALLALKSDGIDMVQLPSNIFDRRFERFGVFEHAKRRGKQIYVRSVFLQGLALMSVEELQGYMQFVSPVLKRLDELCWDSGLTRQGLALCYARYAYPYSKILFGVEMPEQLDENMAYWNESLPVTVVDHVREVFDNVDERILNPIFWNK